MARIMVVDDEIEIQIFLQDTFQQLGYEVILAENGKKAVQYYREYAIDLVIMDLFMPEKEGLRAIVELQLEDPAIQIIVISGGGKMGRTDMLALMKDFGVPYAFAKPFRVLELVRAVNTLKTEDDQTHQTYALYQTHR
ncbi:MAG: response regulator [Candidatus Latescibacterota bacterium]